MHPPPGHPMDTASTVPPVRNQTMLSLLFEEILKPKAL